jgi:ferric-dicitrate binding protein FerR (iron transport regulator)
MDDRGRIVMPGRRKNVDRVGDVMERIAHHDTYGATTPPDELTRRKLINEAVMAVQSRQADAAFGRTLRRHRWVLAFGAAVGIAILLVTGLNRHNTVEKQSLAGSTAEAAMGDLGTVISREGEVRLNGKALLAGASLKLNTPVTTAAGGTSLLALPSGIVMWMESESEMYVAKPDTDHLNVVLKSGKVVFSVDPKRKGPKFGVTTAMGQVEVKGTVFSVLASGKEMEVKVLRGKVMVSDGLADRRSVVAGGALAMPSERRWHLSPRERRMEFVAVAHYGAEIGERAATVRPPTAEEPQLSSPSQNPLDGASPPSGISGSLKSSLESGDDCKRSESRHADSSLKQLTKQIRALRRAKQWQNAALTYRQLIARYPNTNQGRAAVVALGDIQLTMLNRPRDALASYELYLDSGIKTLELEALYGKARALRMLGRTADEKRVLSRMTHQYAGTPQSRSAAARLRQLRLDDML